MLQRVTAGKSSVRPLLCSALHSLRFKSTIVPSRNAVIRPQKSPSEALQDLKSVFHTSNANLLRSYESIMASVAQDELAWLIEKALAVVGRDPSVLQAALSETLSRDVTISEETLKSISRTIAEYNEKVSQEFMQCILLLSKKYPQFVGLFELNVGRNQNSTNSSILVSLYLQERQIEKASAFVLRLLENNYPVNGNTTELVVYHSDIQVASHILHAVELKGLQINSRTLKAFLERAIKLKQADICLSHYDYILKKVIPSKEDLVKLMALIAEVGYIREVKKIYKMIQNYDGTKPSRKVTAEFQSALVKCSARLHGLNKGMEKLAKTKRLSYSVKHYPEFIGSIQVSAKSAKIERVLLHRLNYSMDTALKRFYLNIMLAKLGEVGRIDMGLEAIIKYEKIQQYVDLESIELLVDAVGKSDSLESLRLLLQVMEIKGRMNINNHKTLLNRIYEIVLRSDYWYKIFMVIDNYPLEGYLMDKDLALLLKDRCIENALLHLYNDLNCIPEEYKEDPEDAEYYV